MATSPRWVLVEDLGYERWEIHRLLSSYLGDAGSCRWEVDRFVVTLGHVSLPTIKPVPETARRRVFAVVLHGIRSHDQIRPPFPGDGNSLGIVNALEFVLGGCDPLTTAVASGFGQFLSNGALRSCRPRA